MEQSTFSRNNSKICLILWQNLIKCNEATAIKTTNQSGEWMCVFFLFFHSLDKIAGIDKIDCLWHNYFDWEWKTTCKIMF